MGGNEVIFKFLLSEHVPFHPIFFISFHLSLLLISSFPLSIPFPSLSIKSVSSWHINMLLFYHFSSPILILSSKLRLINPFSPALPNLISLKQCILCEGGSNTFI